MGEEEKVYLDEAGLTRVLGKLNDETIPELEKKIAANNPDVTDVHFATNSTTNAVEITWRDPTNSDWAGTMIRRKLNGPPTGPEDGQLVGISTVRNAHLTVPLTDPNEGSGDGTPVTYHYRFFPYSINGAYTTHGKSYQYEVGVILVSWSSGSDSQIGAMLTAHHNGIIDVRDYWAVGDARTGPGGESLILADGNDTIKLAKTDKQSVKEYAAFVVLINNVVEDIDVGTTPASISAKNYRLKFVQTTRTYTINLTNSSNSLNINYDNAYDNSGNNDDSISAFEWFRRPIISIGNPSITWPDNAVSGSGSKYGNTISATASFVTTVAYGTTNVSSVSKLFPASLRNLGIDYADDNLSDDVIFEMFEETPLYLPDRRIGTRSRKKSVSVGVSVSASCTGAYSGNDASLKTVNYPTHKSILCLEHDSTVTVNTSESELDYLFFGVI